MNTTIDSGPNSSVLDTEGGLKECGHGIHDSHFAGGDAKDVEDRATGEHEDHGLVECGIPCRSFEPPQNNAERVGPGAGGGDSSSPSGEEERRALKECGQRHHDSHFAGGETAGPTTMDVGDRATGEREDHGLVGCEIPCRPFESPQISMEQTEPGTGVENSSSPSREEESRALKECGQGHHDFPFAGGEAAGPKMMDAEDRATGEHEEHGLVGCEVPCRSFESPQISMEQADLGTGVENSLSPPREEERKDGMEDDESLFSLWSEGRGVNVAIFVEGRPEGAHLEENSSVGESHPCNIINSPREQRGDQKKDSSSQREQVEKEGDDSGDDGIVEPLKGFYKDRGNYVANISYQGRTYYLGRTYELRADAALAYDEISKVLRGPTFRLNFSTKSDHIRIREEEMKSNGLRVDLEGTLAMISANVEKVVARVRAPQVENNLGDEAVLKSTESFLRHRKRKNSVGGPAEPVESCDTKKCSERSPEGPELKNDNPTFESLKGFHRSLKRYRSTISHRGKNLKLGTYKLRSDAAFAYDSAGRALEGPKWSKANFRTERDHVDMREKEMRLTGLNVNLEEILAMISMNVMEAVSNIPSDSGQDGDSCISEDDGSDEECSLAGAELESYLAASKSLKGAYRSSTGKSYRSMIFHRGKNRNLGRYKLQSDAAFAYDSAGRALNGPKWSKANFRTERDHVNMREKEMRLTGLNVDLKETIAMISMNVKKAVMKIRSDSGQDGDSCISEDDGSAEECSLAGAELENHLTASKSLKGAYLSSTGKSYRSEIKHRGKSLNLGRYELQSDAAFAYDSLGRALNGPKWSKANFRTQRDHVDMREKEMRLTGLNVDLKETLTRISMNVKKAVTNIRSDSGQDGDSCISEDDSSNEEYCSAGAELENHHAASKSLKGAYRQLDGKSYRSEIFHRGKYCNLGRYKLQSDAAFAYYSAGKALNGPKWSKANFSSKRHYVDMRKKEMRLTGLNVDLKETLARISMNVKKAVSKIRSAFGQDGDSCIGEDDSSSVNKSWWETEPPAIKVLRWVSGMPINVQRRHIAAGLRVKVRFEDNLWYGGVVEGVMYGGIRGQRIKISFDDGTEELTDFPDNDVIVDDVGNGGHLGDALAFVPAVGASCNEICSQRDRSASSITEGLVATKSNAAGASHRPAAIVLDQGARLAIEGWMYGMLLEEERQPTAKQVWPRTRKRGSAVDYRKITRPREGDEAEALPLAPLEEQVRELTSYRKAHGHFPTSTCPNVRLVRLCSGLRRARRCPRKAGPFKLSAAIIAELDAFGFNWNSNNGRHKPPQTLRERIQELRAYQEKYGPGMSHWGINGKKMSNKRLLKFRADLRLSLRHPHRAKYKLSEEDIAELDSFGFDWNLSAGGKCPNMSTDQPMAHQQVREQSPITSHSQERQEEKEQHAGPAAQAQPIPAGVPWFYQDLDGISQGPFSTDQMRYWFQSGYLKDELDISQSRGGPFRSLSSYFPNLSEAFICPNLMQAVEVSMECSERMRRAAQQHRGGI